MENYLRTTTSLVNASQDMRLMDDLANRSIYFAYGFADFQSGKSRQAPDSIAPELQEAWLDGWDEAQDQLSATREVGI